MALQPIFYKILDDQEIMIFNTKHLKKIIKKLDNIKAKEKGQEIIDRKARRCECCGAVILDKYMFTYRKKDGWLTKSYECSVFRGLSSNECEVVKVYKRKHGTKKCKHNKSLYNRKRRNTQTANAQAWTCKNEYIKIPHNLHYVAKA